MAKENIAKDSFGDNDLSQEEGEIEELSKGTRLIKKQLKSKNTDQDSDGNEYDSDEEKTSNEEEQSDIEFEDDDNNYSENTDDDSKSADSILDADIDNDHPLEIEKPKKKKNKIKPLTAAELDEIEKQNKKSGVCYLSRIPPFMTPRRVRQLLSKYTELGKLYLVPEDEKITKRRRKYSKNRRINYTEGWVEFKDKKKAKALAEHLNMKQIGGKRGSQHYHEIWNIKYLPKFKWRHLTEQFAYEKRARQERLRTEMAQAARENKAYLENVDRAKKLKNIQEKKRKRGEQLEDNVKRTFIQRDVVEREVDPKKMKQSIKKVEDPGLQSVLKSVFGK
ncbi:unnamed protein product [Cunninghamella echinulata]